MSKKLEWFKGIHSILTTPLKDDFSVDVEGMKKNAEFGANSNVHALIALGTQGEFYAFTLEEKKAIIKATVEGANGKKPVVAGTSAAATYEAVEATKYAKEVGADAVIVTPPYYAAVNMKGVYAHFEALNEVGIPIQIYNAPARQGYPITPDFLAELCELENIVAVKQASQNMVEHDKALHLIGDKVSVLGGSEAFMFPALALGVAGSSTTCATCFPQIFVDLYEAMEAGDHVEGKRIFDALEPLRKVNGKFGHAAVVKYASEKFFDLAGGPMRLPLPTPKKQDLEREVDPVLKDLGLIN